MDRQANPERDPAPPADGGEYGGEVELTTRQWLMQNGPMLLFLVGLLVFLYVKFGAEGLLSIGKAALGLSFVIFIHELGHFLVAKWCNVHVQVFSIGFGPALPGCHFRWGETTYKLALFPLGGYVQMVGQVDGDESGDGTDDDPRSYRNKTVWQRMAIISAGVFLNAVLAVICFVVVFLGPGKERQAAVVAAVDTGSPSFAHGLPSGAEIKRIGDIQDPHFQDLMIAVMSGHGTDLKLAYDTPGESRPHEIDIRPRKEEGDDRPVIGVLPSSKLELASRRHLGRDWTSPVVPDSVAARAEPAFAFGDRIVAMTDPDDPAAVTDLPDDPRDPGYGQKDYFAFARRMQLLAGRLVTVRVLREVDGKDRAIDVELKPAYHRRVGGVMEMGEVTALRLGSTAAGAGLQARDKAKGVRGDVIQKVEVREPDGRVTHFVEEPALVAGALGLPPLARAWQLNDALHNDNRLDPVRLPDQLRAWARRMAAARVPAEDWKVTLFLRRNNPPGIQREFDDITVEVPWDNAWEFQRAEPLSFESPLAIPELGLGYQVKTSVAAADPLFNGGGADDRLQPGDVVEGVQLHYVTDDKGTVTPGPWTDLKPGQWGHVFWKMQEPNVAKVVLRVNRNKEARELTVTPEDTRDWPSDERGLLLARDTRIQKATDFFDAVALGLRDTHNRVMDVFVSIRGMATGSLSPKNLGGPLMIATAAYRYADIDFWEFIFFLGMISINLAVINFLPIPVLDGGHMVFLLYEAVRGKPASEQVRVGATYAGLLFLASLMLFVLYLDISRLFL